MNDPRSIDRARAPALRLWGWPIVLGLLSASGLVSALLSEGWGDAWSWFALGLPVAVIAWFGLRAPTRPTPVSAVSPNESNPEGRR